MLVSVWVQSVSAGGLVGEDSCRAEVLFENDPV